MEPPKVSMETTPLDVEASKNVEQAATPDQSAERSILEVPTPPVDSQVILLFVLDFSQQIEIYLSILHRQIFRKVMNQ